MDIQEEDGMQIALKKDGAGTVEMKLDMTEYCKACETLIRLKAEKERLEGDEEASSALPGPLDEAIETAQKKFDSEYEKIRKHAHSIDGELYWSNIKSLFADHYSDNPQLYDAFTAISREEPEPLILEALNNSFPELLKNSMDACVKKFLLSEDPDKTAELEINLGFVLEEGDLTFTMTDNGIGFPETYIDKIDEDLKNKTYFLLKEGKDSEKGSDSWFLFGGAGKGLRMLYASVLDGARLGTSGNSETIFDKDTGEASEELRVPSEKIHDVPEGATHVAVTNNPEGGAQITLTTPLMPFDTYQPEESSWESDSEEDSPFEFAMTLPSKARHKAEKEEGVEVKLELPPIGSRRQRLFGERTSPESKPSDPHEHPKKPKPEEDSPEKEEEPDKSSKPGSP